MRYPKFSFPVIPSTSRAQWQAPQQLNAAEQQQMTAALREWLLDSDSLTAKLKRYYSTFEVQVIGQATIPVTHNEAQWLALDEQATVREVILWCDQQPMVFARSVFPHAALQQAGLALAELGNKPLGEHLFQQTDLSRGDIEVCAFAADSTVGQLNQQLGGVAQTVWGRRSRFATRGHHILVAEVFLSASAAYQNTLAEES